MNISLEKSVALIFANFVVLIPFVGWMSFSPLLPPDSLMSVPRILSFSLFLRCLLTGLGLTLITNLLIGLPAIYRLEKKKKVSLSNYMNEVMSWLLIWAIVVGVITGTMYASLLVILMSGVILFISMVIPVCLATIFYWYIAIKNERHMIALISLILLFLFWNIEMMNLAALAGTD